MHTHKSRRIVFYTVPAMFDAHAVPHDIMTIKQVYSARLLSLYLNKITFLDQKIKVKSHRMMKQPYQVQPNFHHG